MNTPDKALRTNRKRKSPRKAQRRALLPAKSARVTATEAKNEFGRVLDKAIRGDVVVITKHDTPTAILMSVDEFNILLGARKSESKINTLSAEFDSLLARMQSSRALKSMEAAFSASPEQLGRAALAAVRKRG
jgi:prevent-host-death family protein